MNEELFDSSKNEYIETVNKNEKELQWGMAIGLQKVDDLTPSKYLEEIIEDNIIGKKTSQEIEDELKNHYIVKGEKDKVDTKEYECDIVSTRIVQLLENKEFKLSIDYLLYIHGYLFKGIYDFAGNIRDINFSKKEKILNGDSAYYGNCSTIRESLEYDLSLERGRDFRRMDIVKFINKLADFTSRVWQVHPFREGNTRTTAVFIEKYLIALGYDVDNTLFKENSIYFRNALVRSNYYNHELNIRPTNEYLIKFFENLLLGKANNLSSEDLVVEELAVKHY